MQSAGVATVYDTPSDHPAPPAYFQEDASWRGLPYATADGTIGDHGCGLVSAAMAASYITGEDVTPPVLLNRVGNTCITAGVNDMGKFCDFLQSAYGIEHSGQLWTKSDALEQVKRGWLAFGGLSGQIKDGGKAYGGHVVLIYRADDSGVWIRDPDDPALDEPISYERFDQINFIYFFAIGDSQ